MRGKSPMMKKLIGKQGNLPAELKAKIMAAPESPAKMYDKKSPAMKKDTHTMPDGTVMPGAKHSAAKMANGKSPAKKYKSDAQRKAVHASKADKGSPSKMYGKSPMKKDKDYDAMQKQSVKNDPARYGKMTAAEYRTEVDRQVKSKKETGSYNVSNKKKIETKTAKPELKKVKVNEKVMEGKKTLGKTKLGNVKVGKDGKKLADTKIGKAFSKGRAKAAESRAKRKATFDAAKAERKAKRDAKKNKK